jgi:hypothetical protein
MPYFTKETLQYFLEETATKTPPGASKKRFAASPCMAFEKLNKDI